MCLILFLIYYSCLMYYIILFLIVLFLFMYFYLPILIVAIFYRHLLLIFGILLVLSLENIIFTNLVKNMMYILLLHLFHYNSYMMNDKMHTFYMLHSLNSIPISMCYNYFHEFNMLNNHCHTLRNKLKYLLFYDNHFLSRFLD